MTRTTKSLAAAALLACLCAAQDVTAQVIARPLPPVERRDRMRVFVEVEQDADELHARGEALERDGRRGEARAAFGEAVRQHLIAYRAETSSRLTPTPESKEEEKAAWRARAADRLRRAAESARRYLLLGDAESEIERSNLAAVAAHAELLREQDASRTAFFAFEVDTRARIDAKPEPGYTEEARARRVGGRVVLRAVLGEDGRVRHPLLLKGLAHGLSERAVEATSNIRFSPALKNGRAVAQFITLEYNFETY